MMNKPEYKPRKIEINRVENCLEYYKVLNRTAINRFTGLGLNKVIPCLKILIKLGKAKEGRCKNHQNYPMYVYFLTKNQFLFETDTPLDKLPIETIDLMRQIPCKNCNKIDKQGNVITGLDSKELTKFWGKGVTLCHSCANI